MDSIHTYTDMLQNGPNEIIGSAACQLASRNYVVKPINEKELLIHITHALLQVVGRNGRRVSTTARLPLLIT